MRGKRYTQEFKESAIQLALNSNEPVRKIANDLGVNHKTLYQWIRDYKIKHNLEVSPSKTNKPTSLESIEEENRRLRKENALLKKEREILKKAAAYFAKETM
jgi:transposase